MPCVNNKNFDSHFRQASCRIRTREGKQREYRVKKILYVDDASSMRKLVNLVLGKEFDMTMASDGQEGYDLAEKAEYDVIISDVNMPVMNGLEFLEKVRANETNKFTPVLMMTTEASAEMKAEGKRLGATGWIVKPFDPEKLPSIIHRVT